MKIGSGVTMGRKARHSDSEFEDDGDFDSDELNVREEGEEENGDEKNDNKDAEREELEKEYMNLRHQEQNIHLYIGIGGCMKLILFIVYSLFSCGDILKNLKRCKDEDLPKGQAVKNQKVLWDKALEFRFLLQKAFSNSNRLPQEPVRSLFCDSHQGVSTAYSDLVDSSKRTLDSLAELQEALFEKNLSLVQATDSKSGQSKKSESSKNIDDDGDEDWSQISKLLSRIATFRDKSINKWQRKTEVITGAAAIKSKLHAFNQNISEQVASYMRDPSRVVRQMQMRKSAVSVFGAFYQQLLKEFFETIDPASSAFYSLKKLHTKKRKIVDRRASKSRKIRYNVHEKIANFMAPETMAVPPMLPDLNNLFGLKKQKPASVV
ncbi:protein AATF-like [Pyrus ussuriensis x Pyrus communis]|uniref:Protein AATF-like n=1 Tax=Pyrus ussuriensis x Pyrus communis TaxID=2448454 RepID=A0A5N5HHW5_9ROSA|nr:protein AATF-like [Pyrus ussuriensis x Pyrus communis]